LEKIQRELRDKMNMLLTANPNPRDNRFILRNNSETSSPDKGSEFGSPNLKPRVKEAVAKVDAW